MRCLQHILMFTLHLWILPGESVKIHFNSFSIIDCDCEFSSIPTFFRLSSTDVIQNVRCYANEFFHRKMTWYVCQIHEFISVLTWCLFATLMHEVFLDLINDYESIWWNIHRFLSYQKYQLKWNIILVHKSLL